VYRVGGTPIRRTRSVVALAVLLLLASVPGLLNVAAKDHPSTAEGVIALVSLAVFAVAVITLIAVAAIRLLRLANPS